MECTVVHTSRNGQLWTPLILSVALTPPEIALRVVMNSPGLAARSLMDRPRAYAGSVSVSFSLFLPRSLSPFRERARGPFKIPR